MSAPAVPRLIYFNGRGRAETSRLLFAYVPLPYEDVRLAAPEFGALKPTLPTGSLPTLDVGGVLYPQSKAIEMYVARKAGLYPVDTELALIVDVVREHLNEFSAPLSAATYGPEADRPAALANLLTNVAPAWLGRLEKLLESRGGVWFTGVGVSYADIAFFNLADMLSNIEAGILATFPLLVALKDRVAAIPTIAAYLAKRA